MAHDPPGIPHVPHVAVVGGGPAGAVAALVLARRGLRVTVLEARPGAAGKPGETLPPSLTPLLRHLGLAAGLERDGHLRSQGNRSIWGAPHPVERPFLATPHGLGWNLDRARFEAHLAAAARHAGADWRWSCRVERCTRIAEDVWHAAGAAHGAARSRRWRIELRASTTPVDAESSARRDAGAGGPAVRRTLEADWLLDATGRHAHVARRAGGAQRLRYDRLVGVAALLGPPSEPAADGYTLVEATAGGWWYSATLPGGLLAVTLFGDGDLVGRSLLDPHTGPALWCRHLRRAPATRERVETLRDAARPRHLAMLPADSSRLDTIAGPGWLAIGDAAAAHDPLSSHGIAAAMGSAYYGAHAVADHLAAGAEPQAPHPADPAPLETSPPLATPEITAYVGLMQDAYNAYLDLLRDRYAAERRWPRAPFWRRRHHPDFALEPLPSAHPATPAVETRGQP